MLAMHGLRQSVVSSNSCIPFFHKCKVLTAMQFCSSSSAQENVVCCEAKVRCGSQISLH